LAEVWILGTEATAEHELSVDIFRNQYPLALVQSQLKQLPVGLVNPLKHKSNNKGRLNHLLTTCSSENIVCHARPRRTIY